jgi:hypothetical protein
MTSAVDRFFEVHTSWPFRDNADVPFGWDAVVAEALTELWALQEKTGVPMHIAQIKEKLGGLRIYVRLEEASAGDLEVVDERPTHTRLRPSATPGSVRQALHAIVDAAAARCDALCETCGAAGTLINRGGYLCVACPEHSRISER